MKFLTLVAFLTLLVAAANANDVKERIREHRESQKLDREVCFSLFLDVACGCLCIKMTLMLKLYSYYIESHQDAFREARSTHVETWPVARESQDAD